MVVDQGELVEYRLKAFERKVIYIVDQRMKAMLLVNVKWAAEDFDRSLGVITGRLTVEGRHG